MTKLISIKKKILKYQPMVRNSEVQWEKKKSQENSIPVSMVLIKILTETANKAIQMAKIRLTQSNMITLQVK